MNTQCFFLILKLEVAGQVAIETAVRVEDAPELMEVYVNKVPTMNECVSVLVCVCVCVYIMYV